MRSSSGSAYLACFRWNELIGVTEGCVSHLSATQKYQRTRPKTPGLLYWRTVYRQLVQDLLVVLLNRIRQRRIVQGTSL